MQQPEDTIYTPEQVAERLQVSVRTIMNYLREHKLTGFRVGRLWRIKERDLQAFIQRGLPETEDTGEAQ